MMWKKVLLMVADYKTTGYDFYDSAFPPLALEYLAASIEDISKVKILDFKAGKYNVKQIKKIIEEFKPNVIGLSVPVTSAINTVLLYAKLSKNLGCTTVLGGWHPTLAVEQTLSSPWVDIVVRGEGELTFRELIEKGSPESVKGLSYKKNGKIIHNPDRPFIKDLDELTFPARDLVKDYNYKIFNMSIDAVETSRGCPQGCKFCSTHVVYKRQWRARSVDSVMKELEIISKKKSNSDIFFVDDNILVNIKRIGRLCIEIIKGKREGRINKQLKFFFQGRLDSIAKNPRIVKLMAEAGFWAVLVGVEATNDKTLIAIDKGCRLNVIKEGIRVLHDNCIIVFGNVIIGVNLDDKIDDVIETIKKTCELNLDLPSFTLLTPFPATEFYREMKARNLLLTNDYSQYNWLTPVIKTPYFNPKVLKKLLFLGFFSIGYYAGDWTNKYQLFSRCLRSRGIKYLIHPGRAYRVVNSYFKWRKIVRSNLKNIKKKELYQIKLGNINEMIGLKNAIMKESG